MKVIPNGLSGLNRAFNQLEIGVKKRVTRTAARNAMKPVKGRLDENLEASKDTGGLAETARLTVSGAQRTLNRAGLDAVVVARVLLGRTRKVEGKTGHQALQVEFGNDKIQGTAPLGRSIEGHEREVITDLGKEWGDGITVEARKARRKSRI